jgi:hypothetical protein
MTGSPPELLTAVVYELLDAHQDTVDLAEDLPEESWRAHLDYLRALQRRGHELLAKADSNRKPWMEAPDER